MFESKAIFRNEKFKFDPRKCNFASSFSGCVQRDKSKMIIALPTKAETVPLFEKKIYWRIYWSKHTAQICH